MNFAFFLYNTFIIPLLYLAFKISGVFNQKIASGIRGRANLIPGLKAKTDALPPAKACFLIHASSMGEYEQTRPVIKLLRQNIPDARIVLTLFSPSAFENIKPNPDVDITTYLPFDSHFAMRKFLRLVKPDVLIITRHDIWPNLLRLAKNQGAITFLIDASVHEGSLRHKPLIRNLNRKIFSMFDHICVISEPALQQMQKFLSDKQHMEIVGDTRFDQVVARATELGVSDLLPADFLSNEQIFIAGSTWPEDEEVIFAAFVNARKKHPELKLIFVPHELTESHLNWAMDQCRQLDINCVKLSRYDAATKTIDVLLVDKMGILANIYGAAKAAYIGGSFGPGVHSVIEAAAHKIPVTFGPRMRNSAEAIAMVEQGSGFVVHDAAELSDLLQRWFGDNQLLAEHSEAAARFVTAHAGASEQIFTIIQSAIARLRNAQSPKAIEHSRLV